MTDPRLGLPSGSSALEDALCHGRFHMQKQWDTFSPQPPEDGNGDGDSEDMDSDREAGKRIHLLYAGQECLKASPEERERAEKGRRVDEAMKTQWLAQFDYEPMGKVRELRETRWWLKHENGKEIYSGQTDAVWIRGSEQGEADILVADLKGLWGHQDNASLNMQIRRYIALIAVNIQQYGFLKLHSAMAYLNQPAVTLNPKPAQFDEEDIAKAVLEMWSDVAAISDPEAKRTAGPVQCHRCRGKLICPEYQEAQSGIMNVVAPPIESGPPAKGEMLLNIKNLEGPELSRLLHWVPALRDAADMAQFIAKERLKSNPESVPGWRLKPNPDRSKVSDVFKVYLRFASLYQIEAAEFTKRCSITRKAAGEYLQEKSGLKGIALERELKMLLDGATVPIKIQPSLERTS